MQSSHHQPVNPHPPTSSRPNLGPDSFAIHQSFYQCDTELPPLGIKWNLWHLFHWFITGTCDTAIVEECLFQAHVIYCVPRCVVRHSLLFSPLFPSCCG